MSALESLLLATVLLVVESQTLPLDVINGDTAPDMSDDQDMVLSAKKKKNRVVENYYEKLGHKIQILVNFAYQFGHVK